MVSNNAFGTLRSVGDDGQTRIWYKARVKELIPNTDATDGYVAVYPSTPDSPNIWFTAPEKMFTTVLSLDEAARYLRLGERLNVRQSVRVEQAFKKAQRVEIQRAKKRQSY